MIIKRSQFTAKDADYHPECNNKDFLEYVLIDTGLSRGVVAHGYMEIEGTKYKWIPLKDVPHIKGEEDAP